MNWSHNVANTASKPSFAINYGLAGGPAHSRRFRVLATKARFKHTSLTKADIIIAHSAGCWLLPHDLHPKLVIYVGMPLTKARPRDILLQANLASFKHGKRLANLKIRATSTYYTMRQSMRNLGIVRDAKTKVGNPVIFKNTPAIFIANQHDPWPKSAEAVQALMDNQDWAFISLPGNHDAIWERSEDYIDIMKHYAKLLA